MNILEQYWWLILCIILASVALLILTSGSRRSESEERPRIGYIIFGPFWPAIDNYFVRRRESGGLARREIIAIIGLLLLFIIAVAFAIWDA